MENPVVIFGATGLGKVAAEIFNTSEILIYCFLDDDEKLHTSEINDVVVMGSTTDDGFLKFIGQKCEAFVAIEDPKERKKIVNMLLQRRKVMPVNAVHPLAVMAGSSIIGHGNLVNAGAIVNAFSKLGNHCIVHSAAVIEYEAELSDFAQVGAGSVIGPRAKIKEGAFVGAGAIIGAGITVGAGAQVAPGAVVLRDVPEGKMVVGNPAQVV